MTFKIIIDIYYQIIYNLIELRLNFYTKEGLKLEKILRREEEFDKLELENLDISKLKFEKVKKNQTFKSAKGKTYKVTLGYIVSSIMLYDMHLDSLRLNEDHLTLKDV